MLIKLLLTLLVLGLACFQAFQGIFSGLVMAVLSVLSAAIAFNYYEALAASLSTAQPATAQALSLVAVFVVTLLVLRALADWAVRGNVVLGSDMISVWSERAIAGGLGLITGMVLTGVLTIAMQMLPFGPSVLGFTPFDGSLRRQQSLSPFYPDQFTLGLVEMLSAGSLSGQRPYAKVHDDLLLENFCGRNRADWYGQIEAPPGCIRVLKAEDFDFRTFKPPVCDPSWTMAQDHSIPPNALGGKLIRVSMLVNVSARDQDNRWRLPGTHFRLVCGSGKSYYPLTGAVTGILDKKGKNIETIAPAGNDPYGKPIYRDYLFRYFQPSQTPETLGRRSYDLTRIALYARLPPVRIIEPSQAGQPGTRIDPENLVVEWIYRIDTGERPDHVVFRRTAEADIPRLAG
jgi:hypothetical protein